MVPKASGPVSLRGDLPPVLYPPGPEVAECRSAQGPRGCVRYSGTRRVSAMWTIALVSEKGGVAKTVTTLNVAACLARLGRRVLAIDADPQHNASLVLLRG